MSRLPEFHIDPDIRAWAAAERGEQGEHFHPRQSVGRCLNCGERSTSDGAWCDSCEADPHEAYERRRAEIARSVQIGRERTAKLLDRMGFADRAAIHRGAR